MKKVLSFFAAILLTTSVFSQSPEKMSYQALVRDASDKLVPNTTIGMQISILQSSVNGTVVYTETQTPTTNLNGLVTIEIGTGTTTDDFSQIDWTDGPYFIKSETDPTGGTNYSISGVSQILSVPYALFAKTSASSLIDEVNDADADTLNEIQDIGLSGTNLSISKGSTVDLSVIQDGVNDADADTLNEIQDIGLSGTNLSITKGSTVDLSAIQDGVNDADADPGNEIQDLSLSGNNLSLSGDATPVDLSGYQNNWEESGSNIFRSTGNVAIGTNDPLDYKLRVSGTANVTSNLVVDGNVVANGVTFGKVYLINSGIIITTDNNQKELYWDKSAGVIKINNNSGDWCDYWWRTQLGATANGMAAAVSGHTSQNIITGTNSNDHSFEIHFGQADGTTGWCSLWLQYANGRMVGHFIKY